MDLYSRKIISWVLSSTLESKWVVQAINKARATRNIDEALIKREYLNRYKILDYEHTYKLVFEYIETFYNTVRIHSHCGYLSPNEYEDRYYSRNTKKAC